MNSRIIYGTPDGGVAVIIPTGELPVEDVFKKDVPQGVEAEIVDVSEIPSDRTFRNAWEKSGKKITTNIAKAKNIAHEKRRNKRAAEFAPLDIEATIPSKAKAAESARQAIREKYEIMQDAIDEAQTTDELKEILGPDEVQQRFR
jgi:hypothetical protein